jgi:phospholipid/cholesterol/gamma-HCH transport system substrate-binding protein
MMTRKALLVMAFVAAGTLIWLVQRSHAHQVIIRTYFHNAQGLKPDAKVRANGLEVGAVKNVSLDSRLGEQPVEVLLKLDSRYAARIPNDSTATIATEGLLGPPYVEIDVSKATGGSISNNGVLKGLDTGNMPVLQVFLNALGEQSKKLAEQSEKLRQTIDSQKPRTKK